MIAGINESKHANVNVGVMVGNVIQISNGITINVDVNVKVRKKILLHVVMKMVNI